MTQDAFVSPTGYPDTPPRRRAPLAHFGEGFREMTPGAERLKIAAGVLDEVEALPIRKAERMMSPAIRMDQVQLKIRRRATDPAAAAEATDQPGSPLASPH